MRKTTILLLTAGLLICQLKAEDPLKEREAQAKSQISSLVKKFNNYQKVYQIQNHFKSECAEVERQIAFANEEIGKGNLSLIFEHIDKINRQVDRIVADLEAAKERTRSKAFLGVLRLLSDNPVFAFMDEVAQMDIPSASAGSADNEAPNPCQEDQARFFEAFRAESQRETAKALSIYYILVDSKCLPAEDVTHAKEWIATRKINLDNKIRIFNANTRPPAGWNEQISQLQVELEVFAKNESEWAKQRQEALQQIARTLALKTDLPEPTTQKPLTAEKTTAKKPELPIATPPPKPLSPLALDVWQSAWGDFRGIEVLLAYCKKNGIRKLNLNPGIPMDEKSLADGYKKVKRLTDSFYAAGIETINFLYAELRYPIENYAKFLREHPELKIDTIVDDSEFTDLNQSKFERNLVMVKNWGIAYGAFVTLESAGNSGVSDATRFWAIENVDFPILMSYFACELEAQKTMLDKYLSYADRLGKIRCVGVAILLGGKHVGREVSCEKLLDAEQLRQFLSDLHQWCLKHPSYNGLVIETDKKVPTADMAFEQPDRSQ